MDEKLYDKTVTCPVCSKNFEVKRVKSKACKVASRDSDFCVYYEDINPLLYDVWVCENCGYAAQIDRFEEISGTDAKVVFESISTRWNKRSFNGERDIETSIEAFKLALYNLQVRKAKASEIARICIRIAWLYRLKKDEKEEVFMRFALKYYREVYEKESFPVEKLDEYTCMYIIAELNRRIGEMDESIKWFSKLVSSPEARKNTSLMESAREQFQLAKEQQKRNKR